ncbi:MAG: tRNA (N(6)-L-threonylcarbamoyladenosine(37)-C(2))-methylthiotransferase [Candidatus Heimdallarchaeota archaeon]|nr:tRNA (N(6)-L-threonylcarbamoyladenosine(37)-C(2))-methylthiotransferase [Candidatus Heimdallarchaeota archaeon]MBY8995525.1 tRNA (N(6)-L-threonylcarbamoyladenosine(37)-C(2))-methylthiotransferase [Candidatus Heimdallarchaeota archaeon]
MEKFFVETFGCTANTSATELMSYLLNECGYEKISETSKADFVLINTCVVKAPTESKIKDLLVKLYQKSPLIVTGCLPQVMVDWCHQKIPQAALLGVDHFGEICQAAKNTLKGKTFELITRKKEFCEEIQRDRDRPLTGILEISKGCTGLCAYCIVRIAKGPLVSKSTNQIIQEAQIALAEGCKELWLTAQDTASYGVDLDTSLPLLLESIVDLPEDFMIRIGMMNIDYASRIMEPLKDFLQHPKIYSFLHIPMQAGSDVVLKKMNRRYTIKEFKLLVEQLRKDINLTLSTDVIVGFPGETEEDFKKTLEVLDEIQFDVVNISKYGDRKGTISSKSQEKLPTEIIKQRSIALTEKVHEMTLARNRNWIGWEGTALALRRDERTTATLLRNKSYKLIAIDNPTIELGKWYDIRITDALKTRLVGSII